MNDFLAFASIHGLVVRRLLDDGKIHRVDTASKPGRRNGAYQYDGNSGWVCDWADGGEVVWFKSDKKPDPEFAARLRRMAAEDDRERERKYARAALEARDIVASCKYDHHRYFAKKDLHGTQGLVAPDGRLVVPMRHFVTGELQSVQFITEDGDKRFLTGGRAKGGAFSMGPQMARAWVCEGLATALTVSTALRLLYRQDRVIVAFSAGNLRYIASEMSDCRVVADNDLPDLNGRQAGQEAAQASGRPWVMPPTAGSDMNDLQAKAGVRVVADLLRTIL